MPMTPRRGQGVLRGRLAATALAVLTLAATGAPAPVAGRGTTLSAADSWAAAPAADAADHAPAALPATARAALRSLPRSARVAFHPTTGQLRFLAGTRARPLATAVELRATARRLGLTGPTALRAVAEADTDLAPAPAAAADTAARAYLATAAPLFGVRRTADLRTQRIRRTPDGRTVVRYQQVRGGIPVIGGELLVGLDRRGGLTSVSGEALPATDTPATTPTLPASRARTIAADWLARDLEAATGRPVDPRAIATANEGLAILDPRIIGSGGPPIPRLVWRIDTRALDAAAGSPLRADVTEHRLILVDARSGDVLEALSRQAAGLERRICDFRNKRTKDFRCLPGRVTRREGDGPTGRQQVDALYRLLAQLHAYWDGRFGRDGIDGKGSAFVATVRYCEPYWCPFQNAFWEWGPQQATFGNGWADDDDLVGHEFTHGVLDHEARLFYDHQSGAMNESFADIFGEGFDLTNDWGNDAPGVRWLIGEDLPIGTVRDMQDPGRFGDADRIRSSRWWSGPGDSGGAHSNSGVGNKAAALIADGGRFNGRQVTGIGLAKMLQVEYAAISERLTSASDYLDLHDALPQACLDLVGSKGITMADCRSVRNAVDATEMDRLPVSGAPRQAPVCATGRFVDTAFFDDLETPGDGQWASRTINGGRNPWNYPPNPNADRDWDGTWASSGDMNLFGDDLARVTNAVIELTEPVTVPPGALLRFEHGYRFDTDSRFRDGGVVEISVDGGPWKDIAARFINSGYTGTIATGRGNPLRGRKAFVGISRGWGASRADLSDLAGKQVRIRFRIGTDDRHGSYGWYIDDIRIYRCVKDGDDPTGTVTIGSGAALVKQKTQTLTITGQDATTTVTRMRVSNSGTKTNGLLKDGVELPFRGTLEWLLTDTAWGGTKGDGAKRVWVQLRDRAGNWSAPFSDLTRLDSGPPVVGMPVVRFVAGGTVAVDEPRLPVRVTFSAVDPGTGLTSTELERRRDTNDWTAIDTGSTTGTAATLRLPGDGSIDWRFRARASDDAGFTSDWSTTDPRTVRGVQEGAGAWKWTGAWTTETDAGAYAGALRWSDAATARATLTTDARQVALVAPRGPDLGIARVLVDGTEVATVDLYAASAADRVLVWTGQLAAGSHALAIAATGQKASASSGTRIVVDALLELR